MSPEITISKIKQEETHRSCVFYGNRDKRPVRVNVFQELLPGFKQALNVRVTGVVVTLQSSIYNTSRGEKGSFIVLPEIRFGEGVMLRK